MKNRLIARGMALCACAVLMSGCVAVAEERHLGDYIYVPAMTAPENTGTISLRVEGLALGEQDDVPEVVESVAGAEFGVYVFSSDGTLRPWANPLYPSEPMRIRTGEEETMFSLPSGTEFFLRQESAPQGYLFDAEALIPVTGDAIVVHNAMAGRIVLSVRDSLDTPIAGVRITVTGEDGSTQTVTTDDEGLAVALCEKEQTYTVMESELPDGIFAARSVSVTGNEAQQAGDAENGFAASMRVEQATCARVTFGHPAAGSVQLTMRLATIDENGQAQELPLADTKLEIVGNGAIVTDENGQAQASLLEGTYDVRLSYEGKEDVILPLSEGRMIVESGATTVIELSAVQATGRVSMLALCDRETTGGSVTLESVATGELYGPYAFDAEGMLVTDALPAGEYRMNGFEAPADTEFSRVVCGGESAQTTDGLVLTVSAGQLTQASIELLTREKQSFLLYAQALDDTGAVRENLIVTGVKLTLIDEEGRDVTQIEAESGRIEVEALSGQYALRMDDAQAGRLGVQPVSEPFSLPAQTDTIAFAASQSRLILAGVDENGMAVGYAQYLVTDGAGRQYTVQTDAEGEAVTPLLAAGEATIETISAPAQHDAAPVSEVSVPAGQAVRVEMTHETYGTARLRVMMQSLDEQGHETRSAISGANIRLYRVADDGRQMTQTGILLVSGEDGVADVQLEPGEYVAQVEAESLSSGCRVPQAIRLTMRNAQQSEGELVCLHALGGVRVQIVGGELTDEQMAQVRFELAGADEQVVQLTVQDGAFYAGDLAAGTYVLRQTQIPEGFTLASERTVTVSGGEATLVQVPLEEYAVLSVSKMGLTFDDSLRTYVVPLAGQYGVYTLENGEMRPYPSAGEQAMVWANVTPEQVAQGKAAQIRLPASLEGTTYYLREVSAETYYGQGFAVDDTYHEIRLLAGVDQTLECVVSSDRGFFSLDQLDAATLAHVSGGRYELISAQTGETVLSFAMGDEAYRNAMAIPVGTYVLRQVSAADGYALSAQPETEITVEPYLTQGGAVTAVQMTCVRVPEQADMDMIADVYTAEQQGLTLVTVDGGTLAQGETLRVPQMTVEIAAEGKERTNITNVVLSSAGDAQGGRYAARVEYCLEGGGWQPSDARMTGLLDGPTVVSLTDVTDDVSAVRITYLNAETGEEIAQSGFTPGQVTLNVQVSAQGEVGVRANALFTGVFAYRTELKGEQMTIARAARQSLDFAAQGTGLFETVCAGRDGRISGVAFFDTNADGVLNAEETGRYAGLTVSLVSQSGDVVNSCRTNADGSYVFDAISSGEYTVQFDAGDGVIFSGSDAYSAHVTSGVADMRYGTSAIMTIDGDHTDYVVNAGCIYAASIDGVIAEQGEELEGLGGLSVELRETDAHAEEEPIVVMTDDMGAFSVTGLLPGTYEVSIDVPAGYLFEEAVDGRITQLVELGQGDRIWLGDELGFVGQRACSVSGAVRIDDDGDGLIDSDAATLSGVRVVLLRAQDGHTEQIAETVTNAQGAYSFGNLYAGEYSVLFELSGEWAFTRYGEDSDVYGAVSQSGSTRSFALAAGMNADGVDAGVTIPAQLTVSVFKDTQYDGLQGPYEEMLEGVSISLIRLENGEDAEEITGRTDAEGSVVFAGVSPGEYVIAYQMPGQWRSTKQVDPSTTQYPVSCVPQSALSTGRSEPFVLTMGQTGVRMVIGAMLSGSISGTVYYDDDANSALGDDEAFCAGVTVELLDAQENVLSVCTSAEDGSYAFEGLAPGRYRVRFTAQDDCGFSGTEKTMARGGVQPADEPVSLTRVITVAGGTATSSADAGIVRLGSVTGVIWEDRDADTARGDGETGLAGVTVHLMNGSGRSILASTTTDERGGFTFERLRPGTYKLRVDAPDDHVFSGALSTGVLPLEREENGRGYSASFTLLGGVHVENIGYGLLTQGSISGRVWLDTDYDGVMQDEEEGLRGVTVTLRDGEGSVVDSTQTIRSGEFSFDDLMPDTYRIDITLPDGYVYTVAGADSRAPRQNEPGVSLELGELPMGETIADVRIGVLKPASVGGVVWMDSDDDGRRQTGDAGLGAVRVTMDVLSGSDMGAVYETQTDETGAYRFDGVMPGDVRLSFEIQEGYAFARNVSASRRVSAVAQADALVAQTDEIAVSAGVNQTEIDVGVVGVGVISGVVWADSVYDGMRTGDEQGVALAQIALVDAASGEQIALTQTDESGEYEIDFVRTGTYQVKVTLPDGMIFTCDGQSAMAAADVSEAMTESFSLAMGESRTALDVGAIVPAAIRGRIVVDENEDGVCGAEETGLSGAVVTAMQGGTVMATAKTQADGSYAFEMLRPGSYRLRVALEEDALFAPDVALNLSYADAQEGETGAYALSMGENLTLDPIPVVKTGEIAGRAWVDEDVDGQIGAGEPALEGVLAELIKVDGEETVIASTTVDEDGRYAFGMLRSGNYAVRFTLPEGMLFTDQTPSGASSVAVVPGNVATTEVFRLEMGETRPDIHVGGILPGQIGDSVWLDLNGNGLQDYKEPLVPGVSLTLLCVHADDTAEEVGTTVSDEYGYYCFRDLRPGTYVIRVNLGEGDTLTFHFGQPLGEIDSDIDPETGISEAIQLRSGQILRNIDIGFTEH